MQRIWRKHFSALLVPEESNADDEIKQIVGNGGDCPANQDEVRTAISLLKNNNSADFELPAELFKAADDELIRSMHQLIRKIWLDECRPGDWSLSGLRPVFKKGNQSIWANYRGISLLSI